ncbi:MAG TPA: bifunctional diaminohydroxyphosphoribosylaminopyrimidine deaminase/5-amino-6-(5-phosphoribosylamino)uracil reductase RibD [Candidatus Omnitrophota bacterium]|nr:bifunctional diaminohydroxyphosphoribosylaminopyrimidine deaminase/5-amino-6-(5-phosphoribosylamino)uracil reductase RibD [Candidatus Omnitrophota bacterium]HQO57967.1 bifunctional diaminohydroxyphosphoribosylaminopyrimidine deaminase/5-amino-6-(5-phosphoribosylamino)uracil reductase RibD [Candidatus Omnitrophota bacterium]HQP11816.1 bifunctional diaminohydroxyphosphoribosylaminopyrimidine deaminase/5-amino-6-(5-phosphoribosylamino)uracil reductase RibD [Candidatus Omnitrophota bacterium]
MQDHVARDEYYMQLAYELALKGRGKTSPNPMVGAVIVKHNRVIGRGWHRRCGGPHAEILAMRQAGPRAVKGAALYVTLEPCFVQGRTPPCVDAVIASGIKTVVIGVKDPNPATHGKSIRKLRRAGILVRVGVLSGCLTEMNTAFEKYILTGMPWVVTKTAQTLDGKIAASTGHSQWITSPQARRFARTLRNEFDAIMVGVETVLKDDPALNPDSPRRPLKKIVVDSRLRTPLHARLFQGSDPGDCWLATSALADPARVERYRRRGHEVIICPGRQSRVDLPWLFRSLPQKGVTRVLIEGGARLIGSALKDKLVDRMHVYIAPAILGDAGGLSSVVGFQRLKINECTRLSWLHSRLIGQDMFIQARVNY